MSAYVSAKDLRHQQATGSPATIVDVRSAEEYSAGHLPGARRIPVDELPHRLAELPADRPVVTY